jgi:hypothetical protein
MLLISFSFAFHTFLYCFSHLDQWVLTPRWVAFYTPISCLRHLSSCFSLLNQLLIAPQSVISHTSIGCLSPSISSFSHFNQLLLALQSVASITSLCRSSCLDLFLPSRLAFFLIRISPTTLTALSCYSHIALLLLSSCFAAILTLLRCFSNLSLLLSVFFSIASRTYSHRFLHRS